MAGLADIILDNPKATAARSNPHTTYANWSHNGSDYWALADLRARLNAPPKGVFRIKGKVMAKGGGGWEIHLVGGTVDISKQQNLHETALVAIGPKSDFNPKAADQWWVGSALI